MPPPDLEPLIEIADGTAVGISGGGGGGGGGTSDNVTIQGDGSGGSPFAVKNLGISTAKLAANAVTAAKIANATITDVQVAAANIDGLVAVASLRTLGTGAQQAAAGNDSRLSDTRTPTDGSVTTAKIVDANVTDAKLATSYLKADGTRALTGDLSAGSHKITSLADPTSAQDAATKAYVDAAAQGLDVKPSVRAATTANITLSGAQTIDGVAVIAGDRVLVKNQSTGSQNGLYVVAAGAWSRSTDADTSAEVTSGLFAFVSEGTVNGGTGWLLTTADPITLGTTSLAFTQFSGGGTYTAGTGLQLTGTQFSIDSTVATLTGSQTLTNKTLTTPTINGATLSGTLSGAHTVSGVATFTAAPIVSIDDGTTNDVTDVATLTHTTTGTAAAGIAAGLLFKAENASGNAANAARVTGRLTTLTNAAENGALDFWTNVAGTMTRQGFIGSDGGLVIGSSTALGAAGIGITKDGSLFGRDTSNASWLNIVQMVNGAQVVVANFSVNTLLKGTSIAVFSTGGFTITTSSNLMCTMATTSAVWGIGDASASPGAFTHRGANASGSNIAASVYTLQAGLPTGNAAVNYLSLKGSIATTSGSGQHTAGESARAYGQYFQFKAGWSTTPTARKTTTYTILITDEYVPVDTSGGAFTATLPAANSVPAGWRVRIKDETRNCGTNNLTISRAGSDTFEDASTTQTISTNGGVVAYQSDGTSKWYFV